MVAASAGRHELEHASLGSWLLAIGCWGLFAGGVAIGFRSWALFFTYLSLVGGRPLAVVLGVGGDDPTPLMAHTVMAMRLYLPLVLAGHFLPWPKLGITAEVAAETCTRGSKDTWADEPHRPIGAATVYYLLLGAVELGLMTRVDPHAIVGH